MTRNRTIDFEQSSFVPIHDLFKEDANVSLFFLTSSAVVFTEEVLDRWYRTNKTGGQLHDQVSMGGHGNITTYRQVQPGSPLACVERQQYCFPGEDKDNKTCTPLSGSLDLINPARYLVDEKRRRETTWMLKTSMDRMILTMHPIAMLGIQVLTSRTGLVGGFQAPLESNQWHLDVQHWHSTAMATLQARFVHYVLGPADSRLEPLWMHPSTKVERQMCNNQVR